MTPKSSVDQNLNITQEKSDIDVKIKDSNKNKSDLFIKKEAKTTSANIYKTNINNNTNLNIKKSDNYCTTTTTNQNLNNSRIKHYSGNLRRQTVATAAIPTTATITSAETQRKLSITSLGAKSTSFRRASILIKLITYFA